MAMLCDKVKFTISDIHIVSMQVLNKWTNNETKKVKKLEILLTWYKVMNIMSEEQA